MSEEEKWHWGDEKPIDIMDLIGEGPHKLDSEFVNKCLDKFEEVGGWESMQDNYTELLEHEAKTQMSIAKSDAVDRALGLRLLPPIRVSEDLYLELLHLAEHEGITLQAYIRDILDIHAEQYRY